MYRTNGLSRFLVIVKNGQAKNPLTLRTLMQGREAECWLDLAKSGWVRGIPVIENSKIPISYLLEDIDFIFKISKNR